MCRWFAYLSEEDVLLADPVSLSFCQREKTGAVVDSFVARQLLRPMHSIVKQISTHWLPDVHVQYAPTDDGSGPNKLSNVDGFGVAWYTKSASEFDAAATASYIRPCLYKTVRPPLNDLNFRSIAENVSSTCIVAHVRAATGRTPVSELNSHPFVFGRFTFAQNGTVACFFEIKTSLLGLISAAARRNILGTSDTEHVAALFFTQLDHDGPWTKTYQLEEMKAALKKTVDILRSLVESIGRPRNECSFLNFVVTDGEQMLASRYAYPVGTEPPSLYYSSKAGPTINRKYEDDPDGPLLAPEDQPTKRNSDYKKHVIIASEPSTYHMEDWTLIPANSLLAVGKDLQVTLTSI
ncbi:glutamine amidotransferase, partial [Phenoliferia sp. Uapishka_3]